MESEFLPIVAVDHVGIVAPSCADIPLYGLFGGRSLETRRMPSGVSVARFGPNRMLEIVVPTREGSPVERFLERRGQGLHHIAFATTESLDRLRGKLADFNLVPIGDIERSSDERPSLFIHPSSTGGVLVELVEVKH